MEKLEETLKATGGAISFYGGKTIHTFTSSGNFTTEPNWSNTNVEYVVIVGGGGAGGGNAGAGGGAGAYTTPKVALFPGNWNNSCSSSAGGGGCNQTMAPGPL